MNEKRYNALPFLLALASLATLSSSFILFILAFLESGFPLGEDEGILVDDMTTIAKYLFFMGWIPGLVLAIFSLVMLRHSQSLLRKISVWIFSALAIIASLLWAIWAIVVFIETFLRPS